MGNKVVLNSQSRVYLISGRARGDHKPSYESCMRMTGLSQDFGDIEKVECPDPDRYGSFIEVAQIRGATGRVTASLEGRYYMTVKSLLMELSNQGCPVDVQLHFGICQDPKAFNEFEKILILEDVYLTNHGTDDLGVLASGDSGGVNETADISASTKYEILPLGYGVKAGDIIVHEVTDVEICDTASCGECADSSSGCDKIFAITKAAGAGSPSAKPTIVFSLDKGITWDWADIEALSSAQDADEIGCVGDYLVVVSQDYGGLAYALKSEHDGTTDPVWTGVTTGFVGAPTCIYSDGSVAYIAGALGYIYYTEEPSAGVTVLDAGTIFVDTFNAIHGIGNSFLVAVGNSGQIVYSTNGTNFSASPATPVGVGVNLNTVWVKSETEWWVGTSTGKLYYTIDAGVTWNEKTFSGSGAGSVKDLKFSTDSVGYLAHVTAAPRGRILRTFDGGYSWVITPEKSGTIPTQEAINAVAVCSSDPNFVVGGGLLSAAGGDGILIVGEG